MIQSYTHNVGFSSADMTHEIMHGKNTICLQWRAAQSRPRADTKLVKAQHAELEQQT